MSHVIRNALKKFAECTKRAYKDCPPRVRNRKRRRARKKRKERAAKREEPWAWRSDAPRRKDHCRDEEGKDVFEFPESDALCTGRDSSLRFRIVHPLRVLRG